MTSDPTYVSPTQAVPIGTSLRLDDRICQVVHAAEWYRQPFDSGKAIQRGPLGRTEACPDCQVAGQAVAGWLDSNHLVSALMSALGETTWPSADVIANTVLAQLQEEALR